MDVYIEIGKRIKKHRKLRRMTQDELANCVNLSRTSIANIELGRHKMGIDKVIEIANTLEIPFACLFPGENNDDNLFWKEQYEKTELRYKKLQAEHDDLKRRIKKLLD